MRLIELILLIKVMYLAVFANGDFNPHQKGVLNDEFERLGLDGDARFMSRKLAQRQKVALEEDFYNALDEIFFAVSAVGDEPELAHRLLVLYMTIVESDGIITVPEEVLARELADCLCLDIDYYLDHRTD